MKLVFVTPAWRRLTLSRICFAQRQNLIEDLSKSGIEATCVVVSDDANLDTAKEFGFETVVRDNRYLGRRFNDGYERALEMGADYICPVGSDTWLHPDLVKKLVAGETHIQASRSYALVRKDGKRLAEVKLIGRYAYGCWVIPAPLFTTPRPCGERKPSGCDRSAFKRLDAPFKEVPWKALDAIGFRAKPHLTQYESYFGRHDVKEYPQPFERIAKRYPAGLVDEVRTFYRA